MKGIPFNKFTLQGKEYDYLQESINNGQISGDNKFTELCNDFLTNKLKVKKTLLTTSCTDALEMVSILLDIKLGDEIIVPSFTFVSTINAFILRGARPVFADIRHDTLNIDENIIESLITEKTKAIVVVHYAGVGCEMDKIMSIAKNNDIKVIEDNAHGLFGKYKKKFLGTFGLFSTQSFHSTKNFSCGEGGALLINDEKYIKRAEIIREKGTNRSEFFRGEINKYGWVDIGSSFLPSDILAAILFGQLEQYKSIQSKRKKIWETYYNELKNLEKLNGFRLPYIPKYCQQPYHMFYLILPSVDIRNKYIKYLKREGINATFHYLPLHSSTMGKRFKSHNCPVTEKISDCIVRLPFFNDLVISNINFKIFYEF